MPDPNPSSYEQLALEATQMANAIQSRGQGIKNLRDHVQRLIGGTATGDDMRMIGIADDISARLNRACVELHQATRLAHRAAQEAADQARAKAEAEARRKR